MQSRNYFNFKDTDKAAGFALRMHSRGYYVYTLHLRSDDPWTDRVYWWLDGFKPALGGDDGEA